MTQEEIVLHICSDNEWHLGGTMRSIQTNWGFLGFGGDRCARSLATRGYLQVDYRGNKNLAWYRITEAGLRKIGVKPKKEGIREYVKRWKVEKALEEWNALASHKVKGT